MKLFDLAIRIAIIITLIVMMIIAIKKEDKDAIYLPNAPALRRKVLPYGY